jgi:uncharacterized protein
MRVLVSGSTGLIGSSLVSFLKARGHEVVPLVRSKKDAAGGGIYWNPQTGDLDKDQFEDFDAVIHLAGENLANGRWTKKRKERIFLSRCRDTWLLSQVLIRLYRPPKSFISASATGFYGNRGGELLTEESRPGKGFLADLCVKWESATEAIQNRGSRVVIPRFGVVLSSKGGMLARLTPLVKMGLGSYIGCGEQLLSWIALEDLVGALYHLLVKEECSGLFNCVSPQPVTQREFIDALARHFHKKVRFRLPAQLVKLIFGEMADDLFLTSQKVSCERLLAAGYTFRLPSINEALSLISV